MIKYHEYGFSYIYEATEKYLCRRYKLYAVVFFGSFVVFTLAMLNGSLQKLDDAAFYYIYGAGGDWARVIAFMGSTRIILSLSLSLLFILAVKKEMIKAFFVFLALSISFVTYQMIKESMARPRPELSETVHRSLPFLSEYSYPSGHTIGTVIFFASLCIFILNISESQPSQKN